MTTYYFPSCKVTEQFPRQTQALQAYIRERLSLEPVGCCRLNHQRLLPGDKALVICNNCANILEESSAASQIEYVWEVIDRDEGFPFPDYQGEAMTVQDCWLAKDRPALHRAVRSLLQKMNIKPVELPERGADSRFCGAMLLAPCSASNAQLAPRRYVQQYPQMFTPLPPAEHPAYFARHCRQITTDRVACYCRNCVNAINAGGKQGIHLLDLLFPNC